MACRKKQENPTDRTCEDRMELQTLGQTIRRRPRRCWVEDFEAGAGIKFPAPRGQEEQEEEKINTIRMHLYLCLPIVSYHLFNQVFVGH
jgi:hypothetical protein